MPRAARHTTVVPHAPHHVILRGNKRRRLFSYPDCYLAFLRFLARAAHAHEVPVHALALMSNHVHLVVTPADAATLARFVKRAAQPYAERRNRARGGTGKLFEQRYVALPIEDVAYLAATLAYVDLNPVRAGLASRGESYPWSTCAVHVGAEGHAAVRDVWSPHEWYVGLAVDDVRRAARYREWLDSRAEPELDTVAERVRDRHDDARRALRVVLRPDETTAA